MGFYPRNTANQRQRSAGGVAVDRAFLAHYVVPADAAVAAETDAVHAAVTDTGEEQTITTEITNPPVARNLTATAGGTAADIGAIQVIVAGTNLAGQAISETLPAFTVDTAGTVAGSKAFKTVTSITIPAHDGTGATTAIGFGEKLGLPDRLSHNTVQDVYLGTTKETNAPTVTVDADELEKNTIDLSSALNGSAVHVYYVV